MKSIRSTVVVVLMLAMAGSVCAGDWKGVAGGGTTDWSVGSNWWSGAAPTSATWANMYWGGITNYPIISSAASANEVYIGGFVDDPSANGRVDMIGGTLTTVSAMVAGVNFNRYGEFNQSGGTTTLGGTLWIALAAGTSGKVNLSDNAALSCNTLGMGYGTTPLSALLNISNNATLTVTSGGVNLDRSGKSLITISGNGKLILAGDKPNFASDNVYYGGLRAGPGQIIVSSYDFMNDNTIITAAIPDPNAFSPQPADSTSGVSPSAWLVWEQGPNSIGQDVYFGTNYSAVLNATAMYGDFNGNGTVDMNDLYVFAQQWLTSSLLNGSSSADFNNDGVVNFADYAFLGNSWGNSDSGVFKGHYKSNVKSFNPGTLQLDITYYWRIDNVQPTQVAKGKVWQFTVASSSNVPLVRVEDGASNTVAAFSGGNGATIQNAINYASRNGYAKVHLEPGTYTLEAASAVGALGGPWCAIYLPDNIELYGSSSSKPVLQFSTAIAKQDAFLAVTADFSNKDASLTSLNIHHLVLQALTGGVVKSATGMLIGKADAAVISIHDIEVYNTSLTAMIFGMVSSYESNPADPCYAMVRQCNGQAGNYGQIYNNMIDHCGGDGIAIIGKYYNIHDNTVQYLATAGVSNAITMFDGSSDTVIQNNTLRYNNCGIGLDGSGVPCFLYKPAGMDDNTYSEQMMAGNEKGFNFSVTMQNNNLYGNTYGVLLYRAKGCRIYGNTISSGSIIANSRGVTLHETNNSFVAGNSISKQTYGVAFWSTGISQYGTQWNGIGLDHNLTTWNNTYSGNITKMTTWVQSPGVVANNTVRD